MKHTLTIKDIAKALNVHHSTVSRALSNDPRVKQETAELIKRYAEENGYLQNYNAISLRGGIRNMIAIIVPNVNHYFFSSFISLIANIAKDMGYMTVVYQSNEKLSEEIEIVNSIICHQLVGVIASISMETQDVAHLKKLNKYNIPLVLFDRVHNDISVSKIVADSYKAVRTTVEKLQQQGYQNIAYWGGNQKNQLFIERISGYRDALSSTQPPLEFEITDPFTVALGEKLFVEMLELPQRPDAIICDSMMLAVGIYRQAKLYNLSIPKDIKVVSFGNINSETALALEISIISQPVEEYAVRTFEVLINEIENPKAEKVISTIELPVYL